MSANAPRRKIKQGPRGRRLDGAALCVTVIKIPRVRRHGEFCVCDMLHSAGDFTGTQTPGTNVHMARGTVHNRLDPLDIGLPSAVGPAVGVRDLDTEGNTLVAELTFSHPLHLLAVRDKTGAKAPCNMIPDFDTKCKRKFQKHQIFFRLVKDRRLYYNIPIRRKRFRAARGRVWK